MKSEKLEGCFVSETISDKVKHVKAAPQSRGHRCHAEGCERQVPPAMFMCKAHWFAVPPRLRSEIWRLYQVGQEEGEAGVTGAYLRATSEAITAVATKEGRR